MTSLGVTLLGLMPIFNVDTSDPTAANFTSDLTKPINDELALYYNPSLTVNLTGLGRIRGVRLVMKNQSLFSKTDMGAEYMKQDKNIYEAFYGVPYARPPVGPLRFASPVSVKPWKELLRNSEPVSGCIHREDTPKYLYLLGAEDCLHLNIFRPFNAKRRLPVMVYIHGGENTRIPLGVMNPESLMITGRIVLVYISFRLGPFGFLTTSDEAMPGNFGLKDQRLALKFIKKHIEHFGGDPNKITIFGHGSGAVACQLHTLNPVSTRYFTQAIIMSGSAIARYTSPTADTHQQAQKLLKRTGVDVSNMNSTEVVNRLRKMEARQILNASYAEKRPATHFNYQYRYVIEDDDVVDAFVKRDPIDSMTEEKTKDMPLMYTFVSGEAARETHAILQSDEATLKFNTHLYPELQRMTGLPEKSVRKLTAHYVAKPKISYDHAKYFVQMFSDFEYMLPMYYALRTHFLKQPTPKQPIFLLKLDYDSAININVPHFKLVGCGLAHGGDTVFLFSDGSLYIQNIHSARIVRTYINELINFAEQNFRQLQECEKDKFGSGLHEICEYREIVGSESEKQLNVQKTRAFNVHKMTLWMQAYLPRKI